MAQIQSQKKVILFVGAPGSGKSTVGRKIQSMYQLPHISTGDVIRNEINQETDIGLTLKEYVAKGELAPAELTDEVILRRFQQEDCSKGFILDGYPRTIEQIKDVKKLLKQINAKITTVIYLNISKETAFARLNSRNENRPDDAMEVQEKRFKAFVDNTLPMLEIFKIKDIVYEIDASKHVQDVTQEIISVIMDNVTLNNSFNKLKNAIKNNNDEYNVEMFLNESLEYNQQTQKRTGEMRVIVFVMTESTEKFIEIEKMFALYGHEVIQTPMLNNEMIQKLLSLGVKGKIVLKAALREVTGLFKPSKKSFEHREKSSVRDGVEADNVSKLTVHLLNKEPYTYEYSIRGVINLKKQDKNDSTVFGWDDIFEIKGVGKTYHELNIMGLKCSSRNNVISEFVKRSVRYAKNKDFNWFPMNPKRTIDFEVDLAKLMKTKFFGMDSVKTSGYINVINSVLNDGIHLRCAISRREANYWAPGLNSGIPALEKGDELHLNTYIAHDLGHNTLKDLIFTGNDSWLTRMVYIIYRMMSEATTMVLADMYFVDGIKKSGFEYDYSTRKIYPLVESSGFDLSDPINREKSLKTLIMANVKCMLKGDDSLYNEILKDKSVLEPFKKKYTPFLGEDYRWTSFNYESMSNKPEVIKNWWESVNPLVQQLESEGIKFETIDDFIKVMQEKDSTINFSDSEPSFLVDFIAEIVIDRNLKTLFLNDTENATLLPYNVRVIKGFKRYMVGQLAIVGQFTFVKESKPFITKMIEILKQGPPKNKNNVNNKNNNDENDDIKDELEWIVYVRGEYENYLSLLLNYHLISEDDRLTFKEVYPIFSPFFVSYDKNVEYEPLDKVFARIFDRNAYRDRQIAKIENGIGKKLTPSNLKFVNHMITMVEESDGILDGGLFVSEPGVLLMAHSENRQLPINEISTTILVAGCSLESSMEFIAHGEGSVARLTSSKTIAMNNPLYSISHNSITNTTVGLENKNCNNKEYIKRMAKMRSKHEQINDNLNTEMWNMTLPGCKATAFTITMTLNDWHKTFIGRMAVASNETEVRVIAKKICTILHEMYPNHIWTSEEYEKSSNTLKYNAEKLNEVHMNDDEDKVISDIVVTQKALNLFKKLNIDTSVIPQKQLIEFRSRITYSVFLPKTADANVYIKKLLNEHGHYSILSSNYVTLYIKNLGDYKLLATKCGGQQRDNYISFSLKGFVKYINEHKALGNLQLVSQIKSLLSSKYDFI